MKNKHILMIFVFGLACVIAGLGFQFMGWQYGELVLSAGLIVQAICMVALVFKIMRGGNDSGSLDS